MNTISKFVNKYGMLNKFGYTTVHALIDFALMVGLFALVLKAII
jgi:hypothetical protein